MRIKEVITANIDSSNDPCGQLELLERKLEALTAAFGVLVEHIGEGAAKKIIEDMSCPDYRVAK